MGRNREYSDNAERQRAYRERKAAEQARMREQLKGFRRGAVHKVRKQVSAKLVKVLGMLGSAHAGERDNAARTATRLLQEAGLTWYDVLDVGEDK
jgi:hypothetical protein